MSVIDGTLAAFRAGRPGFFGDDFTQVNGVYLPLAGGTMTGVLNAGGNKITGLANGTTGTDAVAFGQLAAYLPLAGGTMSGNIAMGSNKITGVANGSNPADAVNFSQLPSVVTSNVLVSPYTGEGSVSNGGADIIWTVGSVTNISMNSSGQVTLTNPSASNSARFMMQACLYGVGTGGNTETIYLMDLAATPYASCTTQITAGTGATYTLFYVTTLGPSSTQSFKVRGVNAGLGTNHFSVSATGAGAISACNQFIITQLN